MISKKDIEEYLGKMLEIEMNMHETYATLARKVKDKELKSVFERISFEETEHAGLVKDLMKLLSKTSL